MNGTTHSIGGNVIEFFDTIAVSIAMLYNSFYQIESAKKYTSDFFVRSYSARRFHNKL